MCVCVCGYYFVAFANRNVADVLCESDKDMYICMCVCVCVCVGIILWPLLMETSLTSCVEASGMCTYACMCKDMYVCMYVVSADIF